MPQNQFGKSLYTSNFKFYSQKLNKTTYFHSINKSNSIFNSTLSLKHINSTNNLVKNNFNNKIYNNNYYDSLNHQSNKMLVKSIVNKDSLINNLDVKIASTLKIDTINNSEKLEPLLVIKEINEHEEEEIELINPVKKSNFWSKAVNLANNLNVLGLKAIKAKENNNNYSIAYKSFAIEKK